MAMADAARVPTPELDKQREVIKSGKNDVIGDFIEWLSPHGYVVARWQKDESDQDVLLPVWTSTSRLLSEYFGIDHDEVERERRALLEAIRKREETPAP